MRRDPIRKPGLTQLLWRRERSDDSKFPFLFFCTGNQTLKAAIDRSLAGWIASEIAGSGRNRKFERPARSMTKAIVGSYRSFHPVGPHSSVLSRRTHLSANQLSTLSIN